MNYQETYYPHLGYEDPSCCHHTVHPHPCMCECECNCKAKCDCQEKINFYARDHHHPHCPCKHHECCENGFASYLCKFINQKVIITIGRKCLKVVVLEVSCSTVKCLLLGAGKLVYLNLDRIDNIRPLSC